VDARRLATQRARQLLYNYFSRSGRLLKTCVHGLEVEVEGMIRKAESGYSFSDIVIRPNLTICGEEEQTRALHLLQKAQAACLVSRALSVEQIFEPHVQVSEPRVEFAQTLPVG
jgi:hypothetical protein